MSKTEKSKQSWRERRKAIIHKLLTPFIFGERICEHVLRFLKKLAIFEILEYAGRLAVVVAVIFYFSESKDRQKAKHYQAWQVINSAQGKTGNGGRIDALQDLNEDNVSLAGINLSYANLADLDIEGATLYRANLSHAEFSSADFSGADLTEANFSGAQLWGANLSEVALYGANLSHAVLIKAKLIGAELVGANLSAARLWEANLSGADFTVADLTGANLLKANLSSANLSGATLHGAYLSGANLSGANLPGVDLRFAELSAIKNWREIRNVKFANILEIKNPPDGFVEWATAHGAVSIGSKDEWKKLIREQMQEKDSGKQAEE